MKYQIDYQPLQLLVDGRWQEIPPVAPGAAARTRK